MHAVLPIWRGLAAILPEELRWIVDRSSQCDVLANVESCGPDHAGVYFKFPHESESTATMHPRIATQRYRPNDPTALPTTVEDIELDISPTGLRASSAANNGGEQSHGLHEESNIFTRGFSTSSGSSTAYADKSSKR